MKVFCVTNRKGGTGKTATAHALGAGLKQRGGRVLFVDLDSQTNLTYELAGKPEAPGSLEAMTGETPAAEAIQHTPGGDLIPATETLTKAEAILPKMARGEYKLREALQPLAAGYDYIIIDTPAALGAVTINALAASNAAIIPAQADIFSLQGLAQLARIINAVKKHYNPGLSVAGILLTRYNGRAILSRDMAAILDETAKQLQTRLFTAKIRECIAIKEAEFKRQDIFTYAPRSNAAADYSAFIEEFLKYAE